MEGAKYMNKLSAIYKNISNILIIFAVLCFIEIWALLGARTEIQLIGTVPDEYIFMEKIISLRDSICNLNVNDVISFGTPYGYGYIYWLLMALIGIPFSFLNYSNLVLLYRLLGILFKAIALYCLYKGISYKTSKLQGILAIVLILSMPAFWFYGKVISPEFIILGLISLSMLFLIKDDLQFKKQYYISVLFFSLAIGMKIILLPLGIIYPIYLLIKRNDKTIKNFILTPLIILPLYLVFNITLVTSIGRNIFIQWLKFNSGNTQKPSFENIKNFYLFNNITWDRILNAGVKLDYLNVYLVIGFIIILLISVYKKNKNVLLIPFGVSFTVYSIFILSTQIQHSWYFLVPALMFVYFIFLNDHKDNIIQGFFIIMIIIVLIVNFPRIIEKYDYRMKINQEIQDNSEVGLLVQDYIKQNYHGGTILSNPFLVLSTNKIVNVKIIDNSDIVVYVENGNLDILKSYPDTEWIYIKNNIVINDFEVVKEFPVGILYKRIN